MSEVLTRSLATSFSTLLGVMSLLVFGGATLQDFAFAMLVGIASGTYSSIFIASPVLTAWKEREPELRARRDRIAAASGGTVPAFMEELPVAKIEDEEEPELEPEAPEVEPEPEPEPAPVPSASPSTGRRSQEEILREAGLTGRRAAPGDGAAEAAEPSAAKGQKRRARQRRRKHGRHR